MCARSNRNSAAAATSSGFSDSSCPRVVCQQREQTLVFPRASALVDAACMRDGTQSMPGDIVGLDGRALSTGHAETIGAPPNPPRALGGRARQCGHALTFLVAAARLGQGGALKYAWQSLTPPRDRVGRRGMATWMMFF